jgi:hypothetical protein
VIRTLPWHALPTPALIDKLRLLTWQTTERGSPAGEVAALMVYVALLFSVEPRSEIALATYDELMVHTGLSRSLVGRGIARLQELKLIQGYGSHQKRRYVILTGYESPADDKVDDDAEEAQRTWYCKLPCRAIVSHDGERIEPFQAFTLRTKHELNALKLYLYFAMVRPREQAFSMASYEVIRTRTGVQERDIRRALSVLVGTGLLQAIDRAHSEATDYNEPNKYFLRGYSDFFIAKARSTLKTEAPAAPMP